jgi:hypothetical protein
VQAAERPPVFFLAGDVARYDTPHGAQPPINIAIKNERERTRATTLAVVTK